MTNAKQATLGTKAPSGFICFLPFTQESLQRIQFGGYRYRIESIDGEQWLTVPPVSPLLGGPR